MEDFINPYAVKARTKKVNAHLNTLDRLPADLREDVADLIIEGANDPEFWAILAKMSGTHVAGIGTQHALAILLGTGQA